MAQRVQRPSLLERWARLAHRRRGRVIGAWFLIVVAAIFLQVQFGGEYISEFKIPGAESQAAQDLLEDNFPARSGGDSDIVWESQAGVHDAAVQARIEQLFTDVSQIEGVSGIESPYNGSDFMVSDDGTIGRAMVHWSVKASDVPASSIDHYLGLIDAANGNGLTVETGGDVVWQNEQPEFGSEALGMLLALFILLIAFGSIVAAGLPIAAAIFGLVLGFSVISLATNAWAFPEFSPQFAAMIGIGVGIDYSLLVITRFREGLHSGRTVEDSIVLALTTAGRSVIFAGVVVAISFLGLFVVGLPFVAALGTAGALVVVGSVLVALTLMPSLMSLAGTRVDRWKVPFLHSTEGVDTKSGWYRLSKAIQRRPLPYFLSATAILLVLAAPILTMELGFTDAGNGSTELHSRRAYDLLAKGFGPGFNGPLYNAVDLKGGSGNVVPTARQDLASLEQAFRETPGVAEVVPAVVNEAGDTALIIVYPTTSPQDEATVDLVHTLRHEVVPQAKGATTVYVGGGVAGNVDAADKITSRMPFLFVGVIGLSFLLLMTVFRSVLVAVKAAIMNLLSIGAAYGVVVAVFQWGWGANLIGVEPGPIEVFLPMMMFAILFGLSMDYEVFLISRVREEYLATKDNATAVSHGLTATARVITAAAAIMVSVFGAFVLGPDRVIKEFGIGLATAIFVDATIVRLFLVPATMELLGERNWWMPKWLDRVLPNINIDGARRQPEAALPGGSPAGGQ